MLVAILGRQPVLGFAELQSVFGKDNVNMVSDYTAKINAEPISLDRFGSVIKFAEVIGEFQSASPYNLQKIIIHTITKDLPLREGVKIKIGISLYGGDVSSGKINSMGLSIKKALKNKGYSIRLIPNKQQSLSSAQVLHNKLVSESGIEIVLIKKNDSYIIARNIHEQDIEAYAARDQARPKRDTRVGMLPPKLAQTIINLAAGPAKPKQNLILDAFCGTGVILQEAALMGFDLYGTDLEPKMINYTEDNLKWLNTKQLQISKNITLSQGDATIFKWQPMPKIVASETYLGRPLSSLPKPDVLNKIIQDVNTLHKKALVNIYNQLPKGSRICLAVPAWQVAIGRFKSLPILDQIDKIGYNQLEFKNINAKDLIYAREDQIVGRQLVVLTK